MKHKLNIGNGALQYDRVTGKYVSASTPTISIGYSLPANFSLQLFNVSTSKYDGGNYITFSYKADVKGLYDGGITYTVDYGRISGSFQVVNDFLSCHRTALTNCH